MFKVGQKVRFISQGSPITGAQGKVVGFDPFFFCYEVDFEMPIGILTVMESDIELVEDLPVGLGNELWYGKDLTKKCDCGGFKTFGSMEPEMHSAWCSSIEKKKS